MKQYPQEPSIGKQYSQDWRDKIVRWSLRESLHVHFIQFSYQLPFVHLAFLGLNPDHDLVLSGATKI